MTKAFDRDQAILQSRAVIGGSYVIIDTETTNVLPAQAEVVAIGIVGQSISKEPIEWHSLIHPHHFIPPDTTKIHGITNEMVLDAPYISAVWHRCVRDFLLLAQTIVGYNLRYDLGCLENGLREDREGIKIPRDKSFDVMLAYAAFVGEIKPETGTYKWQKLIDALCQCELPYPGTAHDALCDAQATELLLYYMADAKTSWELALDAACKTIDTARDMEDIPGIVVMEADLNEFNRLLEAVDYRHK